MLRWTAEELDPGLLAERNAAISVCVPALNEAPTIAEVLEPLLAAREAGLVDQVLVADAGSADATARRARAAGAEVAAVGAGGGKGETVQRALHHLTGELLLFVDGDLTGVDDRIVPGLAAPLLIEPGIQLVKAAFHRSGGRVTELTAKPLLGALYPELTALTQPLSGQVGIRRAWMEQLPIWPGYGLEIGVLLATYKRHGLDAIAEVDVGRLENAQQDLDALAGMAVEVVEAVMYELVREGRYGGEPPAGEPLAPFAATVTRR